MSDSEKKVETCAGIALINKGRIFLIRPSFDSIPQNYGIPKGHIEPGEDSETAALREFKEETGIDLSNKNIEFLTTVSTKIGKNAIKVVHVYKVHGDGTERFISSNLRENGTPENIYGGYMLFKTAKQLITTFQIPIINKLLEDGKSSFETFYKDNS